MLEVFVFLLGLAVGSFLNVLIDRLPRDESVVKGRSYCDGCKKPLLWYDLIPVVSFLFLGGKCRHCGSPISFYYPMVELVTGVMFVLTFFLLFTSEESFGHLRGGTAPAALLGGDLLELGYYLFIVSSLIVIFFADLKYGIIPDKVVFPGIFVNFLYLLLNTSYLLQNIMAATGVFLFFFLLYIITKGRGMGFGDVKLVFLLGLFLGWPYIIIALYFSFLTGAIFGCILILWRKKRLHGATLPFGPFLVLGTFVSLFWGEYILGRISEGLPSTRTVLGLLW